MSTIVVKVNSTKSRKSAARLYVEKCKREAKEAEEERRRWIEEEETKRKQKEEEERNKPPETSEERIAREQKRQDVDFKQMVKRFGKRPTAITKEDRYMAIYSVLFGGRFEGKAWHQKGTSEYYMGWYQNVEFLTRQHIETLCTILDLTFNTFNMPELQEMRAWLKSKPMITRKEIELKATKLGLRKNIKPDQPNSYYVWILFHAFTMTSKNEKYDIMSVLSDYMFRFFPCQICEEHFSQNMQTHLFQKVLRYRKYSNMVRLYIFHNIVNQHTGKPNNTVWLEKPFRWTYTRVMKSRSEIDNHRVINQMVLHLSHYFHEHTKLNASIDGVNITSFISDNKDSLEKGVSAFLTEFYCPLFEDCQVESAVYEKKEDVNDNPRDLRKVQSEKRGGNRRDKALKRYQKQQSLWDEPNHEKLTKSQTTRRTVRHSGATTELVFQ